jgi:hypothetical protein
LDASFVGPPIHFPKVAQPPAIDESTVDRLYPATDHFESAGLKAFDHQKSKSQHVVQLFIEYARE